MAKVDTSGLHRDIKAFAGQLKDGIGKAQALVAQMAVRELVNINVPVWFGPYVKSFRVAIGTIDTSTEPYMPSLPPWPPRMPADQARALIMDVQQDLLEKVKIVPPFSTVNVSNSIGYAGLVEYIGWPEYGHPPYFIFTRAISETEAHTKDLNRFVQRGGRKFG